ncbi:MAG: NAD-dependent epimerase/dehydratase family protein [Spirochaetaceae bacterium]|nr:MAG: NAD-dependent epimerase/dehydratase family protein [Spirochaetaceae bacterium]
MLTDQRIENEEQLEQVLSRPYPQTVELLGSTEGDFLVLGAGGKMGPTLCRLLKNACAASGRERRVYAVSRFSDPEAQNRLESAGIQTIRADLLDPSVYAALPDAANIFFLAGMKFGASAREELTWAMNTYVPALAADRWSGPGLRLVVFSTGNVYPFVPVDSGGADEDTIPAPLGEYAMSCLGRERIFQHFSTVRGTRTVLIRLNYANELRYGVLVDLAQKVVTGQAIDLAMDHVNVIWQGDANNYIARSLSVASSPAAVLNVAGAETLEVRWLAEQIGRLAGKKVSFTGSPQPTALLSDSSRCLDLFGPPAVPLDWMLSQVVDWVRGGGKTLKKPTKFQVRDGKF